MRVYAVVVLAVWLDCSSGHGSLNEPPSRASAWRHGFPTAPDYDDDGAYCGGFGVQWDLNGGACGICGDAWNLPEPRPHELGGRYGTGLIVRSYAPGELVPVTVNLTTSHRGFWVLKLCPDATENNQGCFDRYILEQADGQREFRPDISRVYRLVYRLPEGLTCERCVIQWAYTAGNNWGQCDDGTSALGCGRQENFRACADISIQDSVKLDNEINVKADNSHKIAVKLAVNVLEKTIFSKADEDPIENLYQNPKSKNRVTVKGGFLFEPKALKNVDDTAQTRNDINVFHVDPITGAASDQVGAVPYALGLSETVGERLFNRANILKEPKIFEEISLQSSPHTDPENDNLLSHVKESS